MKIGSESGQNVSLCYSVYEITGSVHEKSDKRRIKTDICFVDQCAGKWRKCMSSETVILTCFWYDSLSKSFLPVSILNKRRHLINLENCNFASSWFQVSLLVAMNFLYFTKNTCELLIRSACSHIGKALSPKPENKTMISPTVAQKFRLFLAWLVI